MHAFTPSYVWSFQVTWQKWWSHNSISHSWKPHATCKPHDSMFYRSRVMANRSFTLLEYTFSTFSAPVTLTLTWRPSYANFTCIPWRYTGCVKKNFLRQVFWKLSYYSLWRRSFSYRWSRDKDGDHIISSVIAENPITHANLMALSLIEPELRAIKVYTARIGIFDFFAPMTLTLNRWPSYTNLTHIALRDTKCANMNFLCQCFRKLSSDRYTYIHTQPKLYTMPPHGWSIKFSQHNWLFYIHQHEQMLN